MKYGKLTILSTYTKKVGKTHRRYDHVRCDCGNELDVRHDCLLDGNTQSCGCIIKDHHFKIHGDAKGKFYHLWAAMKDRCNNPNNRHYNCYGGRGIKVCDEWNTPQGYIPFKTWALAHGYKEGLTIDRIDVNGNYEPNNCRWITIQEQANNTRRTVLITHNNETYNINQWAKKLNINKNTLWRYIRVKQYSIDEIIKIRDKKCND